LVALEASTITPEATMAPKTKQQAVSKPHGYEFFGP
jgi:hypothetical protein